MYNKIAITNRALCKGDFITKLAELANSDWQYIVLREKELDEEEYFRLAEKAFAVCGEKLILHSYVNAAKRLDYNKIHLPMQAFRALKNRTEFTVGVSAHTIEELKEAEKMGAAYATISPIFATDCKKGVKPKGLEFLKRACREVTLPVYALGGISEENAESCISVGAYGVCMMSQAMK